MFNRIYALRILFLVIVLTLGLLLLVTPIVPVPPASGQGPLSYTSIICNSAMTYCVDGRNGSSFILYANDGTTPRAQINGVYGWQKYNLPSTVGTGTPAVVVDNAGNSLLMVLKKAGTPVFSVDGAGNVDVTTNITVGGAYVGITPVATATSILGSALYTFTQVAGNSFIQAGTPVVAYATPMMVSGATPLYCVLGSVTITGTGTVANHGLTTPLYAIPWLAQDATGDAEKVTSTISGITVTLKVWNSALTPAANATGAAVKYSICGTK